LTVWSEVEEALEAIIRDYEKINHIISLFQDDRARRIGLSKVGAVRGVGLELGSGPGNFTRMLHRHLDGFLVCLDYSDKMLSIGRARLGYGNIMFVRGVFEALPIKESVISLTAAAFALRDTIDKERALKDVNHALRKRGKVLVVDIGKPNNRFIRKVIELYIRYVVPFIGGVFAGDGYDNPWKIIYKTYCLLPLNKDLLKMMDNVFFKARMKELSFGGLVIATAEKNQ
jgi:demethylmenaquinone methyltransferase/2-methoxy-6-polyprenyl-1,4-benzoquinol methylase